MWTKKRGAVPQTPMNCECHYTRHIKYLYLAHSKISRSLQFFFAFIRWYDERFHYIRRIKCLSIDLNQLLSFICFVFKCNSNVEQSVQFLCFHSSSVTWRFDFHQGNDDEKREVGKRKKKKLNYLQWINDLVFVSEFAINFRITFVGKTWPK